MFVIRLHKSSLSPQNASLRHIIIWKLLPEKVHPEKGWGAPPITQSNWCCTGGLGAGLRRVWPRTWSWGCVWRPPCWSCRGGWSPRGRWRCGAPWCHCVGARPLTEAASRCVQRRLYSAGSPHSQHGVNILHHTRARDNNFWRDCGGQHFDS